jgi:RNA polymerase sigma-70 factor (ECF subfamily)
MTGAPDDPRGLEPLLARAARVRALARALCADVTAADDLAQDALVVALERPGSERAPLAWFRRVLERLALDRGRSEGARRGRERRVARPEAQPDTLDLVARADLQRRLVEAVLALPEPYREALLERWFEERTPAEIARRLGIPASTVRTRLARGQALLRERLAEREGHAWLGALAALGGERGSGPLATVGTGGLLVTTGTKLALVASALAAGALWFAWPERGVSPPASLQPSVAVAPEAESPEDEERALQLRSEVVASEVTAPERASASTAALPEELSEAEAAALELADGVVEPGILRGLVLRGRTPIAGGTAWLAPGIRYPPRDPREPWTGLHNPVPTPAGNEARSTPIGPDGRFQFEGVRGMYQSLAIDGGQGVERLMTLPAQNTGKLHWRTVVVVLGSASIAGHVYDELGAPVVGARVKTFQNLRRNEHMRAFVSSTTTDSAGAYALRELPAGSWPVQLNRDGNPFGPAEFMQVELGLGQQATLDFGRAWPLPVWSGTLRARTGDPVWGVWLTLEEPTRGWRRELCVVDGTFRIPLERGTYRVTAPVVARTLEDVELATVEIGEADLERDLELPGTRVRGLALDAATGAVWAREVEQTIAIHPRGHDYSAAFSTCQVAPDGSFVFNGLWPGEWVLVGDPFEASALGGCEAAITVHEAEVEVEVTVNLVLP